MKKILTILLFSISTHSIAFADTRIVIDSYDGKSSIWLNDKYIRMSFKDSNPQGDNPGPPGDMIANFSSGKSYMIIDKTKTLVDTSTPPMMFGAMMPKKSEHKIIKATYKNKGPGKTISGLKTTQYEVSIQGRKCFDMLLTKNQAYASAMKKIDSLHDDAGDFESICDQINEQVDIEANEKYGYPVKSITADGKLEMLVVEFKTNVKAPAKYLSFPSGYKIKTMTQIMQEEMAKQFPQ